MEEEVNPNKSVDHLMQQRIATSIGSKKISGILKKD
jgi:hypothetical protein